MRIQLTKDLLSGFLFLFFGLGCVYMSTHYRLGTPMQMGPGFFPMLLGAVIALIGLLIVLRAWQHPELSEEVGQWEIRPLVFILASIIACALLIDTMGLIPAIVAIVLISHLGARQSSFKELVLLSIILSAIASGIFVYALNIPIKLGPF